MSKRPLCVAVLWHMHQPDYRDTQTGEFRLPWTRLHAIKDYYDMAALVARVPGMHLTINVVPSLIDQLVAYGQGISRETVAALTLRNAADLDTREKAFLLRGFFQLAWDQMLLPYPRYKDLLDRRGRPDDRGEFPDGIGSYSARDYRDLQVWFNLSWCGRELRQDPEIAALFKKGMGFTEEEKKRLLELQYAFIARILPFYRKLMEENVIEISVTPYYHPILPLLCDNRCAREALPEIQLPADSFLFPQDGVDQIRRAQQRYLEVLGRAPTGMWPSEGSISDATLALARDARLNWLASDEEVLANSLRKSGGLDGSLRPEQKYSVQRWGKGTSGPCLFFRDRSLSDRIGFTYSGWKAQEAAADFVSHLQEIRDGLPDDGRNYVVPVILDGENAWEHYPSNGVEFLSCLYRSLTESAEFRTVTFSEFLGLESHREQLESVVAGSWIYGTLSTWIGHPEKNRAWEQLAAARRFLQSNWLQVKSNVREQAFREILIAEGSDWFWWYGDDHHSENAAEFDALFRDHLKNIYRFMGQPYPGSLDIPTKMPDTRAHYRNPIHTITPQIDGRVTDYFEWLPAGFASPTGGDAMHRTERQIERIYFGYDTLRFYLRVDLRDLREGKFPPEWSLQVRFLAPAECFIDVTRDQHGRWHSSVARTSAINPAAELGADKIIELSVPLETLGITKPDNVTFFVALTELDRELERFPASGLLTVAVDPWELNQREWMV